MTLNVGKPLTVTAQHKHKIRDIKMVSVYDQEIPQSQTNPAARESQILQVVCAAEQVG